MLPAEHRVDARFSASRNTDPFRKGDWVLHVARHQKLRVQRDQLPEGLERYWIWCEWEDPGYHLVMYDASELESLPREQWLENLADAG